MKSVKNYTRHDFSALLMNSGFNERRLRTVFKNLLSVEEARYLIKQHGRTATISATDPAHQDKEVRSDQKNGWFFYTDNYIFGLRGEQPRELLPQNFVASSTSFPSYVVARPELPTGCIHSIEAFETIYYQDKTRIETYEGLLDVLEKHFGYFV